MFRKQDFKKVDLLGSGKKNTKIYKAEHIPTGKYYAIKEVEAKTLDKLNEYKVSWVTIDTQVANQLSWYIGGSSTAIQSSKSSQRPSVLWLLFLRDHVQYV